jgi:hypothetical protein
MNEVITNPRLLFPLYLVLTNTFLITTHYPTEPIEKYENAEMWMTLVSVILMHRLVQKNQQQQFQSFRRYYTLDTLDTLDQLDPQQQTNVQDIDVFLNEYSDVDSDDSEEIVG